MNKFMKLAIEEAQKGIRNGHGGPFGSVIVKNGVVVGQSHNQVVSTNDPTAHGEIMAIRDACSKLNTFDLSGCELYTTSEPCPMCKGAIQWAGIAKVYYGCTVQDAEDLGFRDVTYATFEIPTEQIMKTECAELFKEYLTTNPIIY